MTAAMVHPYPRFSPVGDSALLIELDGEMSPTTNARVFALDARMRQSSLPGVVEWVPAYVSLLVLYDPMQVTLRGVYQWVQEQLDCRLNDWDQKPKRVEIAVRYGGVDGPDLGFVARFHELSLADVVEKHTAQVYRVGMMGFTPGFAYLSGLDPDLATPRLSTPRTLVPAGSIGIAGSQTGIYPLESPGGWQLIGRTDRGLFDPDHAPHFLLSPGDEVRFIPLRDGAVS